MRDGLILSSVLALALAALGPASGCEAETEDPVIFAGATSAAPSISPAPVAAARRATRADLTGVPTRSGSALVMSPGGGSLVLADEDHRVVRRIPVPIAAGTPPVEIAMPGAPAQVIALADRVLVTIRDPGLLIELVDVGGTLQESARVEVAGDAWGLAVTADGATAIVTSAWTHRVTAVDLASMQQRWSVVVAREPRGVAVTDEGVAYVSHLTGAALTRIQGVASEAPEVWQVELPASPLRTPTGQTLGASLGYSVVLSPHGERLFAPRHALGAHASEWWFGQATVDVLLPDGDAPLAPARPSGGPHGNWGMQADIDVEAPIPPRQAPFVQPRAAIYRPSKHTLLVAGEGDNVIAELDALALDPTLAARRIYAVAKYDEKEAPWPSIVRTGGAPTGIALSPDDKLAYVFCRSTGDLVTVALDDFGPEAKASPLRAANASAPSVLHLRDDLLDADAAIGRRLYYDATDGAVSGGLGCAGCHPDGRDDGHVWHEIVQTELSADDQGYRAIPVVFRFGEVNVRPGHPRQTPMLAGRVASPGPYGWIGESPNLETRVRVGFALHRWQGGRISYGATLDRPKQLAAFVRSGLVAPHVPARALTPVEERGAQLFASPAVGCATCHDPTTDLTNRSLALVARPLAKGFLEEPEARFKTPSLLFVGGTPPYYHDGSARSLDLLVHDNGKAMGDTSALGAEDRMALAAYLRTLGGAVEPFPDAAPRARPAVPDPSTASIGAMPWNGAWHQAPVVETPGGGLAGCTVKRLAHWLRVDCTKQASVVSIDALAGGLAEAQSSPGQMDDFFGFAAQHYTFALREGQSRVFHLSGAASQGRWGTRPTTMAVLQASWRLGEREPSVILR